jgi:hypothetical protein
MDAQAREAVATRLARGLLTGSAVLSRFRLLDEASRRSVAYTDPRYVPFYHHLGQEVRPRTVVEFGLRLGLTSGTLLRSCGSVEHFLGFQEPPDEFYSPRLAAHNLRSAFRGDTQIFVGRPDDPRLEALLAARPWDIALVNEEREYDAHLLYLDLIWKHLALDGSVLVEHARSHPPAGRAYHDFCKRVNRDPYVFNTRYGTGVITK